MSKYLGLDLGTNSIGWAVIDNAAIKSRNYGVYTLDNIPRQKKIKRKDTKNKAIFTLNILIGIGAIFCIINFENWQFWINVILTTFIAKVTFEK